MLACPHAIHSCCDQFLRELTSYWLTAMQIMSVSLACAIRPPSRLVKFSFDIKDHNYSLTVSEKNVPVEWNFALVWNPSSHQRLRLSWLSLNFQSTWPVYVEHNVRPIVLGRVCLYCGENIICGIFFKCPWAPWWLGAHDGCMACSVPSSVVQAVSYCVIKHVNSGPVTIIFWVRQDL